MTNEKARAMFNKIVEEMRESDRIYRENMRRLLAPRKGFWGWVDRLFRRFDL